MKVTIVIPNYNGKKYLNNCLDALATQSFQDFETILVDNASTDGSVSYVKACYPNVCIVRSSKNRGFAGAANAGVRRASSPYVVLLNNDTVADSNFLLHLVCAIEQSDNIFSVSSRMLNLYAPDLIDSAGDLYTLPGYAVCRGMGLTARCYQRADRIFSACGGAAIYRRTLFFKLGGFDERFFAYLEDVDLGYRAKLSGYENRYCPGAIVYHARGGTAGTGYTPFKVYYSARNNVWLNYKNMPRPQLILNALPIACGCLLKYFYFGRRGLGGTYLEGLSDGIRSRSLLGPIRHTRNQKRLAWRIERELVKNTLIYAKDLILRRLSRSKVRPTAAGKNRAFVK